LARKNFKAMVVKPLKYLIAYVNDFFLLLAGAACLSIIFNDKMANVPDGIVDLTLFFLGATIFTGFLNSFFTGKNFDKKFKDFLENSAEANDELFSPVLTAKILIQSRNIRTMFYAFPLVVPQISYKKRELYFKWFKGFDFKKNARRVDKFFSYLFISFAYLFFLLAALAILSKLTYWALY
jgi:hypothetical protein